jgi:hypothetical protein
VLVDLGEGQHQPAAAALGRGPERRGAGGVVPFETMPAEAALGVLMVEEVDQPPHHHHRISFLDAACEPM